MKEHFPFKKDKAVALLNMLTGFQDFKPCSLQVLAMMAFEIEMHFIDYDEFDLIGGEYIVGSHGIINRDFVFETILSQVNFTASNQIVLKEPKPTCFIENEFSSHEIDVIAKLHSMMVSNDFEKGEKQSILRMKSLGKKCGDKVSVLELIDNDFSRLEAIGYMQDYETFGLYEK